MEQQDNGNGRVTMAIIGQKLDEILRRLDKIEHCMDLQEERLRQNELGAVHRDEKITELRQDVDRLQTRDTWGNLTTGLMAAFAAALHWIK